LKGKAPKGRLEESASFNAMCSHRIRLAGENEVDEEIINWIKEAYQNAG